MCSRQRYADGGDSLERLRREAETEMRRVLDESRPRKRPRGDEDGLLAPIDRYRYAVVQELEAGAKGFIVTCNFQREKSATREASQLLRRYLPEHIFPTPLESDGGRVHTPGPSGQARSGSGSGLPCYGKAVAVSSAKGPDGSQQLDDTATAAATQIAAGASVKRVRQASASGGGSAGGGGHVGGSTGESCDGEDDSSDGDGKGHNGDPGELLGLGKVEGRDGGGSAGGGNDAPEQGEGLQCGSRGGAGAWAEGAADREGGDRELPALGLAKVGCRGVVLIRLSAAAAAEIDPVAVVDSMLADLKTGSLKPPRHCQRIIPLDATCLLTPSGLSAAVAAAAAAFKRRCQQQLDGGGRGAAPDVLEPLQFSFAIGYRSRVTEAFAPSAATPPAVTLTSIRRGAPPGDGAGSVADTAAQCEEQQRLANQQQQQEQQLTEGQKLEQQQQQQQQQQHGKDERAFERSQILSVVGASMVEAFGAAATVNLKKPQVAVLVEAVPVAGRHFAGVTLLPEHMFVSKGRLVIKPLVTNASA